jgi:hypothetical protein
MNGVGAGHPCVLVKHPDPISPFKRFTPVVIANAHEAFQSDCWMTIL